MKRWTGNLLLSVLVVLGIGCPAAFAQERDDLASMEFAEMVGAAERLRALGESGEADLSLLVDEVQRRYIAPDAAAGLATCEQWWWMCEHAASSLGAERKAQWRRALRAVYATPEQLGSLPGSELAGLGRALRALGDPDAMSLIVQIGESRRHEVWRHSGSMEVTALAGHLAGRADGDLARTLAEWLLEERLVDEESARRLSPGHGMSHWRMLALHLRGAMDEELAGRWGAALRGLYVDSDGFASRRLSDVDSLLQTLGHLGDVDGTDIMARWLTGRAGLSENDRMRVLRRADRWAGVARRGGGALASDNVAALAAALRGIGENPAAGALSAAWLNGEGNRQTLTARSLGSLATGLGEAGAAGWHARRGLGDVVANQILPAPAAITSLRPDEWGRVIQAVRDDLSVDARREWAGRIWDAYRGDHPMPPLERDDLRGLVWAIRRLDEGLANRHAAQWLAASDEWRRDPQNAPHYASETIWYAYAALGGGASGAGFDVTRTIDRLGPVWDEAYAADQLSQARCQLLAWVWFWRGDREQAQRWLYRAQDVLVNQARRGQEVEFGALVAMANGLGAVEFGLQRSGAEFPVLAAMVVEHLAAGNAIPAEAMDALARACHGASAREVLYAGLRDEHGLPRLDVAHLLARSHRADGTLGAWDQYVQGQANAATTADATALWLLALADVETLRPVEVDARRGRHTVIRALAEADCDAVRVRAARELAARHVVSERPEGFDAARQVIAALREQFEDEGEGAAALERLDRELQTRRESVVRRNAWRQAQREHAQQVARLHGYQRMLDRARAGGEADVIAALEGQIRSLQQAMGH